MPFRRRMSARCFAQPGSVMPGSSRVPREARHHPGREQLHSKPCSFREIITQLERGRVSMAENESIRKARELRRQLMGEAFVERMDRTAYADPIMKKFADLAAETVFAALWARPGLDLKTRTLVCLVSDAATGRLPQPAAHPPT